MLLRLLLNYFPLYTLISFISNSLSSKVEGEGEKEEGWGSETNNSYPQGSNQDKMDSPNYHLCRRRDSGSRLNWRCSSRNGCRSLLRNNILHHRLGSKGRSLRLRSHRGRSYQELV